MTPVRDHVLVVVAVSFSFLLVICRRRSIARAPSTPKELTFAGFAAGCCLALERVFLAQDALQGMIHVFCGHQCKPMLAVRADEVAEKSPWKGREANIPCSRRYGRREPSRVLSRF